MPGWLFQQMWRNIWPNAADRWTETFQNARGLITRIPRITAASFAWHMRNAYPDGYLVGRPDYHCWKALDENERDKSLPMVWLKPAITQEEQLAQHADDRLSKDVVYRNKWAHQIQAGMVRMDQYGEDIEAWIPLKIPQPYGDEDESRQYFLMNGVRYTIVRKVPRKGQMHLGTWLDEDYDFNSDEE